jgi:hypothetical protein
METPAGHLERWSHGRLIDVGTAPMPPCTRTYHAAPWEREWRVNAAWLASNWSAHGCQRVLRDLPLAHEWLDLAARAASRPLQRREWRSQVLSSFRYSGDCGMPPGSGVGPTAVPIEPLIGALRHPLFHCAKLERLAQREAASSSRRFRHDGKVWPPGVARPRLVRTLIVQ